MSEAYSVDGPWYPAALDPTVTAVTDLLESQALTDEDIIAALLDQGLSLGDDPDGFMDDLWSSGAIGLPIYVLDGRMATAQSPIARPLAAYNTPHTTLSRPSSEARPAKNAPVMKPTPPWIVFMI